MRSFVRALIVATACLATGWWLLRDAPEQERLSESTPAQSEALSARGAGPRAIAAERDDELGADAPSAAPLVGDESRADPATSAAGGVEPIPMIDGIVLPGGMWNLHAAMERESRDVEWADQMEREFSSYFEPNRVKIAWTLEVEPQSPTSARLATETRALATDDEARRQFRRYWRWARFGIVAIRWFMLPAIRRQAERTWKQRTSEQDHRGSRRAV